MSTFTVTGTVRRVNLEGGRWALEADDGSRYELVATSVPPEYLRDGRRGTFALQPRPDLMSLGMLGPIVEVLAADGPGRSGG